MSADAVPKYPFNRGERTDAEPCAHRRIKQVSFGFDDPPRWICDECGENFSESVHADNAIMQVLFLTGELQTAKERADRLEAKLDALRGLLTTARPLAKATLNAALRWNDHNFDDDAPHRWAKEAADEIGFPRTPDGDAAAVAWLERVNAAIAADA